MAKARAKSQSRTKVKPAATQARRLKKPQYRSFRLSKKVRYQKRALPGAFKLFRGSLRHLGRHRRLYGGLVVVYLVLTLVIVKGFAVSSGVGEVKEVLQEVFTGKSGSLLTGLTLYGFLLASTGATPSEVAGLYQSILALLVTLAVIWSLRQTHAGTRTTVRQTFYKGMYPLIPFLLTLGVVVLQLIPLAIGGWLYQVVIVGQIAVTAAEQVIWGLFIAMLAILSFYMLTSSLFALYIVTLPDMTPLRALRSARELVRNRRWQVMRKILALPLLVVLLTGVLMVPLIIVAAGLAEWVFLGLSMATLVVIHSYLYALYRELL